MVVVSDSWSCFVLVSLIVLLYGNGLGLCDDFGCSGSYFKFKE